MRIPVDASLFAMRSRKVFFLTVVAVATVIYLGVARDYFSLSQYAALTPKKHILVKVESELLGSEIRHQHKDEVDFGDLAPRDIPVAEMFDVPTNETTREVAVFQTQKEAKRPAVHGSSNKVTQMSASDYDDESGNDDDDDDDDEDGDGNDGKNHEFSVGRSHRNDDDDEEDDDNDDDEENDKDKDDDDDNGNDHNEGSPIGDHHIWSLPFSRKETPGTPQSLNITTIILKRSKPLRTQKIVKSPTVILTNLPAGKMSESSVEETRQHLLVEELDTQQNQVNRSFESSDRILNLTDADTFTRTPVVQTVHQTHKKHGRHKASQFPPIKPIPPPVGFSTKLLTSETNLLSLVFNDTFDSLENYNETTVCPLLEIRQARKPPENVYCIPRSRELSLKSCIKASKEYELNSKPLKCANSESNRQLCSFKPVNWFPNQSTPAVLCDTSPCGTNPVYVLEFSPIFGIILENKFWKRFFTSRGLEKYLERYTNAISAHSFNFCFLLCVQKERTGFIEQLLMFPFVHKSFDEALNDKLNFNLNILVLDSVSRPHFYRSLPKTVKSLREIVHFSSYNATVFDFELLQSSAAYTFHNIRALMSGKMDFRYSGGHENETYGIDVLFGKFKQLGYYTLLQEDSCWYDSWGSLFTDNTYQGNMPRDKYEFANRWKKFRDKVKNYHIDDFGLSHASCEIFKRFNMTNQFNHPRKVCFRGKHFAEYFLDYSESIYNNLKVMGKKTRLLTYTHLNTGHEVTGTRIRQIDERLSDYIKHMARNEDTLTIVLSDHGPKTTKYSFQTMEGRAEKYDPFLFIIVPEKVAQMLGLEKIRALAQNQNRLITTLDLHNGFMSLGATDTSTKNVDSGIFGSIPANRTCANLLMKPLAVCKCENWEVMFPDNDKRFTWLAEFALGNINNQIQNQFLRGAKQVQGYGNCQRLVGKSFSKIRRRAQGGNFITTMDITVTPGNEIFEVQIRYPQRLKKQTSFLNLTVFERITIYRHFRKCVDSSVSLALCICGNNKLQKQPTKRKRRKWIQIKSREDVLEIIYQSHSFASQTRVKDIHKGCLLLMYRNHGGRSTSFEISNTCDDRTYHVTISVTDLNTKKYFVSRKIPFSIFVPQRTIHFLLVIKRFEKFSHNLRLKVKHLVEYLN
ncbi:hypothetical protein ACROYT_G025855, partial [Oculina patagonica]